MRVGRSGVGTARDGPAAPLTVPPVRRGAPGGCSVVDDSDPIRDLVVVNLELEGFEVRSAPDGGGLATRRRVWRPDVITLDVVMPRLDGFETSARLRADAGTATIPMVHGHRRARWPPTGPAARRSGWTPT